MNEKVYEYETTLNEFIKELKVDYGWQENFYPRLVGCELDKIVPFEVRNLPIKVTTTSIYNTKSKTKAHLWIVKGVDLLQYIPKYHLKTYWITDELVLIRLNGALIIIKNGLFEIYFSSLSPL